MLSIRCLVPLLPVVVLASACGRSERVETTTAWEKIYDRPADAATAIEMFDDQYGLAIIGHGIERTTDGGLTWRETDSSDDASGHIAIADRDHAWIAGASGAMLRTDDGGLTWQHQQTGTQAPFNDIAALSAGEAWATAFVFGSGQGFPPHGDSALLHTVDGGATWQSVDVPGYGIFLGVWFVGDDGWLLATQCHPGDPLDDPSAEPGAPGHAPCNDRRTLLHTSDAGRAWDVVAQRPATVPDMIDRVDKMHAYGIGVGPCEGAVCATYGLYATSDGGRTWEPLAPLDFGLGIRGLRFASESDGWVAGARCAPPNCGSMPGFAHTLDGGRSWEYVDTPAESLLTFDIGAGRVVSSVAGTGVSLYDPATGTWQPSSTDARPELTRISFATRDVGYATTDGGALWVTGDGGKTWSLRSDALRWEITSTGALWASDASRTIHLTEDGGRSTRDLSPPSEAHSSGRFSIVAAAGDRVWLVLDGGLWRTDDGGVTWRQIDAAQNADYHFIDAQHAWMMARVSAGCDDAIRVTDDGGDTWERRPVPHNAYCDVAFSTPLDASGVLHNETGDCYCRIVTHDGGRSWQTVSTAPWSLSTLLWIDAARAWGVAAFLPLTQPPVVVSTLDGGRTWKEEFSLERPVPTQLVARDDRIWLYLSTTRLNLPDGAHETPRRTMIYRRDIAGAPEGTPSAVASNLFPLVAAPLLGFAVALAAAAAVWRARGPLT